MSENYDESTPAVDMERTIEDPTKINEGLYKGADVESTVGDLKEDITDEEINTPTFSHADLDRSPNQGGTYHYYAGIDPNDSLYTTNNRLKLESTIYKRPTVGAPAISAQIDGPEYHGWNEPGGQWFNGRPKGTNTEGGVQYNLITYEPPRVTYLRSSRETRHLVPAFLKHIQDRVIGMPLAPSDDLSRHSSKFVQKLQETGDVDPAEASMEVNGAYFSPRTDNKSVVEGIINKSNYPDEVTDLGVENIDRAHAQIKDEIRQRIRDRKPVQPYNPNPAYEQLKLF